MVDLSSNTIKVGGVAHSLAWLTRLPGSLACLAHSLAWLTRLSNTLYGSVKMFNQTTPITGLFLLLVSREKNHRSFEVGNGFWKVVKMHIFYTVGRYLVVCRGARSVMGLDVVRRRGELMKAAHVSFDTYCTSSYRGMPEISR
jgi:hypothetical protein